MKAEDFKLYYTRLANLNDVQQIVDLSLMLAMNTTYSHLPMDRKKLTKVIETLIIECPHETLMLVSEDANKKVVGFLAGVPYEIVFSREKIALEIGWQVNPDADDVKKRYLELRAAFEEWVRRRGMTYAQYAVLNPTEKDFHAVNKQKNATVLELVYHRKVTED